MATEIRLPEVSESVESGDVVKVLVSVGDTIEADQAVIELETDKAMFEVPATEGGTVAEIKVKEGDSIKVGDVILTLDSNGKAPAKEDDKEEKKEETKEEEPKEEKTEKEEQPKEEDSEEKEEKADEDVEKKEGKDSEKEAKSKEEDPKEKEEKAGDDVEEKEKQTEKEDKAKEETAEGKKEEAKAEDKEERDTKDKGDKGAEKEYSAEREPKDVPMEEAPKREGIAAPAPPSVRRLARELGVDINEVTGTGTGGRISDEDVKKFVKSVITKGAPVGASSGGGMAHKPLPDFTKWGEIETEKMSNVRRVTAEGLSYAWNTTPMVTQFDEADITDLEAFRKKNVPAIKEKGGQLTVTAILLKVTEAALRNFPQFNASIDIEKKEIIYKKYFNIGIAADTDRGLLVPVIKDVDKKSLTDLSIELHEISEKARDRKITPEEMDGGNFTISNLGGIGGTGFTPIVYSPQVAILGVSRASYKPVYKDGEFVPRFVLPLMVTYDHRIIDGADAARFLRWICSSLENPFNMML
jgi:pyruvate dehydrogenase E2 component (dihydrolipoamide acetyltransferase)